MKTYIVIGEYRGKVLATVKADSLLDALMKLSQAEEDSLEIIDTSDFTYREADVREGK